MKRLTILGVVFILVLSFSGLNLKAENKKSDVFLNFGAMGAYGIGLWTTGINMDFHLGNSLMLSPEVMVYGWRFHFDHLLIAPSLMLNTKYKSIFLGAGVTKMFLVSINDDSFGSIFLLKFNVGTNVGKLRLSAFATTDFSFSALLFGATIGLRL
jgi:hypothetical protein